MGYASVKDALLRTCDDVDRNHTLQMAAALSYYFVLSLFPALIFLSATIAYLPIADLPHQAQVLLAPLLPAEGMDLIRRVLGDVVRSDRGTFLSFGLLGTLWTISGGFAAIIEALNIAFEVKDNRPFWKTRPLAVGLAFIVGTLVLISLCVMVLGPRFGEWLAGKVHLSQGLIGFVRRGLFVFRFRLCCGRCQFRNKRVHFIGLSAFGKLADGMIHFRAQAQKQVANGVDCQVARRTQPTRNLSWIAMQAFSDISLSHAGTLRFSSEEGS